ncbi:MAG: SET domain-containing protein [Candidatus Methylacidiphilales bacterium]
MLPNNNSFPEIIEAPEADYLYIKPSNILNAGNGLFTAINIYKNEIIAIYDGEIINQKELAKRTLNKENKYMMNLPNGSVFDTQNLAGFAKFANDANGTLPATFKNNAYITLNPKNQVCLVALKNIKSNQEILCDYGKNYWNNLQIEEALKQP